MKRSAVWLAVCTGLGNAATAIDAVIADLGPDLPDSALALFSDGFEGGSTNAWSSTVGLLP